MVNQTACALVEVIIRETSNPNERERAIDGLRRKAERAGTVETLFGTPIVMATPTRSYADVRRERENEELRREVETLRSEVEKTRRAKPARASAPAIVPAGDPREVLARLIEKAGGNLSRVARDIAHDRASLHGVLHGRYAVTRDLAHKFAAYLGQPAGDELLAAIRAEEDANLARDRRRVRGVKRFSAR